MKRLIKKVFKTFGFDIVSSYQLYRNDPLFQLKKIFKDDDVNVIFDVGAATGEFCLKFNKMYNNSKIYAFEPQLDYYKHNVKYNGNICNSFQFALSDKIGEFDFFITKGKESSSLLKSQKTNTSFDNQLEISESIKITTNTITNFCNEHKIERINIIKLDTQGTELQVLQGAENFLLNQKIDAIYTEALFMPFYENQPIFHNYVDYLQKFNYHLYNIYNCVYINNSILCWADAIFLRKELYEMQLIRNNQDR